ncbi:MAG: hypothetical protein GY720_19725 [bacterium]|nr:hypothetical protein [bacterium]
MELAELQALVGTELPVGSYRIDRATHARAVGAVHAGDYNFNVAHPMFGHLAPHCGMGWELVEFFDVVGAGLDDGVLFGQGDLTYNGPIELDVDYEVRGRISSVERKIGSRKGVFDLITLELELLGDEPTPVVVSKETYVFPRAEASA